MSDNVCDVKLKKLRYLDKLRLSEAGKASALAWIIGMDLQM